MTNRQHSTNKAALTRAVNSGDQARVVAACKAAVTMWEGAYWPDDWARWQRALDSVHPFGCGPSLSDIGH